MRRLWLACAALAFLAPPVSCERVYDQIYSDIEGAVACFRRLNATHQAGCSSADGGAQGVIHVIQAESDAEWVVSEASAGPYVALVNTQLFNSVIGALIAKPANIAGVMLYDNDSYVPPYFSEESRCPNEHASAAGSQCSAAAGGGVVWNPHGSGLLRSDIPFPIFYLPPARNEEVVKLYDCYTRFNHFDRDNQNGRPLCSLQLSSFMFAAVNAEVCMRRSSIIANLNPTKLCDPVGDRNIFSTLFPRVKEAGVEPNRSVILVTARLDSASLFDGISPGAASAAVGLATFLTAASTLAKMLPQARSSNYNRNVLWALFNGEAFDYIGSQRVAYDLAQGSWPPTVPLAAAQVDLHVEVGQLGGDVARATGGKWTLSAFTPEYPGTTGAEISSFIDSITNGEPMLDVSKQETNNLPPSSLHSFRRILGNSTENGGLAELLLVDHGTSFTNHYYHSVMDDKRNVGFKYCNRSVDTDGNFIDTSKMISDGFLTDDSMQVKIARLATALAKALYQRVTGAAYSGSLSGSAHMVDELLHCYLERRGCRMFRAAEFGPPEGSAEPEVADGPFPMYAGVSGWYNHMPYTTAMLLALLTGEFNSTARVDCKTPSENGYSFYWLAGWNDTGVCVLTTVNLTDAISPAFTIPGYDYSSGRYSTWTESIWRGLWARVFVTASGGGARTAAVLGAISTALAGVVAYWLKKHGDIIFSEPTSASTVTINTDPSAAGILRTVNC